MGHSRKLLDFLCAALKKQGFSLLLSSSQSDEAEPQQWHEHMGFQKNGSMTHVLETGEVFYRLLL